MIYTSQVSCEQLSLRQRIKSWDLTALVSPCPAIIVSRNYTVRNTVKQFITRQFVDFPWVSSKLWSFRCLKDVKEVNA